MVVSGQIRSPAAFGDLVIANWKEAGLHRPSLIKPVMATFRKDLVIHKLGSLQEQDRNGLRGLLDAVLER
jgi:mRNA interferase MazF